MPADPPVDFQALAQGATGTTNADYPYSIKATDLMKDFVFATLDMNDGLYEDITGLQGHRQRKLKIRPGTRAGQIAYWDGNEYVPFDAPPGSGTHVLGSVSGELQWIETEDC